MAKKTKRRASKRPLVPVHPRAAGLDVGATFHVVAVPPEVDAEPVRTFQSFTGDLYTLTDWLKSVGITTIADSQTRSKPTTVYCAERARYVGTH